MNRMNAIEIKINNIDYVAFPKCYIQRCYPDLHSKVTELKTINSNISNNYLNYLDDINRRNMANWEDRGE